MKNSRSIIARSRKLQLFIVGFIIYLMVWTALSVTPVSAYRNENPQIPDASDINPELLDEMESLGIDEASIEEMMADLYGNQGNDLLFGETFPTSMFASMEDLDQENFLDDYSQSLIQAENARIPEISVSDPDLELGTVILNETDSFITTLTILEDGSTIERTTTKAIPVVSMSETSFDLEDLVVPIIHVKTGEASEQLTTTVTKKVNITIKVVYTWTETVTKIVSTDGFTTGSKYPGIDYACMVLIDQYKMIHFSTYTSTFKMLLPLEVNITYPDACIAGETYEFEVTINPLGYGDMSLTLHSAYNIKTYEHIITKETKLWLKILAWVGIIGVVAVLLVMELIVQGSVELLAYLLGLLPSPPSGDPPTYEDYAEDSWNMQVREQKWVYAKTFKSGEMTYYKKNPNRSVTGTGSSIETPLGDRPTIFSFNGASTGTLTYKKYSSGRGKGTKGWKTYDCPGLTKISLQSCSGAIFGDKVTAELAVTGQDFNNVRTMAWGEESADLTAQQKAQLLEDKMYLISRVVHRQTVPDYLLNSINSLSNEYGANGDDINGLVVTIPENTTSTSTRFSLSNLNYYIEGFGFVPQYITSYGNMKPLVSSAYDWTWGKTPNFAGNVYKCVQGITPSSPIKSGYSYSTDLGVFPAGDYDFNMSISPMDTEMAGDPSFQQYAVGLTSLGDSEDYIDLEVTDLPLGFSAHIDQQTNYIRPDQGNEAIVTISCTGNPTVESGPINFTLIATSQAKVTRKEVDPSITLQAEYEVPDIVSIDFLPEIGYYEVAPSDTPVINFTGLNTGNVADNFTIFAEMIGPLGTSWNWTGDFVTSRYTTDNQSFFGEFNFTYSPEYFFPRTDNISLFITVTSETDPLVTNTTEYILNFLPYCNLTTTLTPAFTMMLGDYHQEYILTVTNVGNIVDYYSISADGWTDYLEFGNKTGWLHVGDSQEYLIQLTVPDPIAVPVQEYQFRIFAESEEHKEWFDDTQIYSLSTATIEYLDPGLVPPGLQSRYNGSMLVHPLTTLNIGPIWTPVDYDSGTYSIYVNDTSTFTGSWTSDEDITAVMKNVLGYGYYTYNVTAVFADSYGNTTSDHVWVLIDPADTEPPIIYAGSDLTIPENWAYPLVINWYYEEAYVYNLSLLRNGIHLDYTDFVIWSDGESPDNAWNVTYMLNPGSHGVGNWNFTLDLKDMCGFNETSTIMVDILPADNTAPVLILPPASSTSQGHGEILPFTANDAYHHHYEILVDGVSMYSDAWYSGIPANIPVDKLDMILGENDAELLVYDLSENIYSYPWTLTLVDNEDPVIVSSPENVVVFEHNNTGILFPSWTAEDQYPGQFTVNYRDGSSWELLFDGVWSPFNNTVSMAINNLGKGIHEFQAVFTDTSGNEVSSTFTVTVMDIVAPALVPMSPITYEPFRVARWFEFIIDESNPLTYQLYLDNALIGTGDLSPDYQVVLVDLGYLPDGEYNYTLIMTDDSGNVGTGSTIVTVFDLTPPVIDGPPLMTVPEGTGELLSWIINEANPSSYSLYRNGSLIVTVDISSTPAPILINHTIDDLALGVYEFVITVEDINGLSRSLTTYVYVLDLTPPLISMLGDYNAEPGDPNAVLVWEITEAHPASYQLLVDGTAVQEGPWTGDDIQLQLVGWALGTYEVTLRVTDSSGNTATNELTVTIATGALTSAPFESSFGSFLTVLVALVLMAAIVSINNRKRRYK